MFRGEGKQARLGALSGRIRARGSALVHLAKLCSYGALRAWCWRTIRNFGDALWWAIATITIVGYGDAVPVALEGKAVAVFLMLVGIALFGVLTAGIAAYFLESADQKGRGVGTKELMERLELIEALLEKQNETLAALLAQQGEQK